MSEDARTLTLEGLARKLEELTEKLGDLEQENDGLRRKMAELVRPATDGADGAADSPAEPAAGALEGPVSRRALLGKAGAAAVAAAAAGVLLSPREAKAVNDAEFRDVRCRKLLAGDLVSGLRLVGRDGVSGTGTIGVRGTSVATGQAGVYGTTWGGTVSNPQVVFGPGVVGDGRGNWPGVWGRNPAADGVTGETGGAAKSGVYGRHNGTSGFGVTGDGKGNTGAGVLGRNQTGTGVQGQSSEYGYSAVYGQHDGSYGYGVAGAGKGEFGAGVIGRNGAGYGGHFGGGKAQLRLDPGSRAGRPATGEHAKGELYMDSNATLWVCTADGTPGTWRRVDTSA